MQQSTGTSSGPGAFFSFKLLSGPSEIVHCDLFCIYFSVMRYELDEFVLVLSGPQMFFFLDTSAALVALCSNGRYWPFSSRIPRGTAVNGLLRFRSPMNWSQMSRSDDIIVARCCLLCLRAERVIAFLVPLSSVPDFLFLSILCVLRCVPLSPRKGRMVVFQRSSF